jgi:hypothetical protein
MPKHWLFFPIDRGKVRVVTFSLLFHRNTAAMAFDAYVAAEKGDRSGLAPMSMAYDFIVPSIGVWGDYFSKGSTDYDGSRDYAGEMDPPGSIIGSPLSLLIWPAVAARSSWPMVLLPESIRHVQLSNVETLIISGNLDFSTPAEAATQELLPALKHGEQIVLKEMGHCGDLMGIQPQAFAHLLTSFYDSGAADASLFTYSPMDFHVRFGFPAIAKILVAVAALVVIGLAILVWLVAKRIQKRVRHLPAEL